MQKTLTVAISSIPILIMIGLIPLVQNDYLLTLLYIIIIVISQMIKRNKKDNVIMLFGFIIMIISEYIFISTGVETFTRNSLLGLMPLWLPFLWAYGFVLISRNVEIIRK
jgi:hypothetical protein